MDSLVTVVGDSVAAVAAAGTTLQGYIGIDPESAIGQIVYPVAAMVIGYVLTFWKWLMKKNPSVMPKVALGVAAVLGVNASNGFSIESSIYGIGLAWSATGAWEWGGGWIAKNMPGLSFLTANKTGLKFDGSDATK